MNNADFTANVQDTLGRCEDTLIKKAKEYASDEDRLHNFVQAAHLQKITPRQALAGMMAKHTVSVYDMAMSDQTFSSEMWDEKIGDHLNYLLILRAMVADEDKDPSLSNNRELARLRDQLQGSDFKKKPSPLEGEPEDSKGYTEGFGLPGVPLAG